MPSFRARKSGHAKSPHTSGPDGLRRAAQGTGALGVTRENGAGTGVAGAHHPQECGGTQRPAGGRNAAHDPGHSGEVETSVPRGRLRWPVGRASSGRSADGLGRRCGAHRQSAGSGGRSASSRTAMRRSSCPKTHNSWRKYGISWACTWIGPNERSSCAWTKSRRSDVASFPRTLASKRLDRT